MKKIIKNTNSILKIVNNLPIKHHHFYCRRHIISKDWEEAYSLLAPIYKELDEEYSAIDMVDLIFYERWLNDRH